MVDCIVIGAGISGLSAAWALHQQGKTVAVLDGAEQVGGWIQTHAIGPYLLEGGPTSFPSRGSEALQTLAREVGLTPHPAQPLQKKRYIALDQQLLPVPSGPLSFLTTPLLSPIAKAHLLAEGLRGPSRQGAKGLEPTVKEWASYRLGRQVHDRLIAPFLTGVYAGDTQAMSASAVFPGLWAMEQTHGSLTRGLLAKQLGRPKTDPNRRTPTTMAPPPEFTALSLRERDLPKEVGEGLLPSTSGRGFDEVRGEGFKDWKDSTKPASRKVPYQLLNFKQGMAALPQAISHSLPPGTVRLGWKVRSIKKAIGGGYRVDCGWRGELEAPAVILATAADAAAYLLNDMAQNTPLAPCLDTLRTIDYEPITVAHLAYPKASVQRPLDGFGMLCCWEKALSPLLGSIWASSLYPERCPKEEVLINLFFGGAHHRQVALWEPDELAQQAIEAAQWVLQVRQPSPPPKLLKTFTYHRAIPQYGLGHTQRMDELAATLPQVLPGIALAGNYLAGINLNKCVLSGQLAAHAVG
jgi:protoporphyrinogen/coproporphyrinogen III oxidase